MDKFSLGMSRTDIESEISKALLESFSKARSNEAYICLKMLNQMLPQDL